MAGRQKEVVSCLQHLVVVVHPDLQKQWGPGQRWGAPPGEPRAVLVGSTGVGEDWAVQGGKSVFSERGGVCIFFPLIN